MTHFAVFLFSVPLYNCEVFVGKETVITLAQKPSSCRYNFRSNTSGQLAVSGSQGRCVCPVPLQCFATEVNRQHGILHSPRQKFEI